MKKIRIMVVDDSESYRKMLKDFLPSEADMDLIGEAADGWEAIIKAREFKPDLILMDIKMPGINGIEATRCIKTEMPQIEILILSIFDLEEYREAAISSGASGYIVNKLIGKDLFPAIRRTFKPGKTT